MWRFARRHVSPDLLDTALNETVRHARGDTERASQTALNSTGLFLAHTSRYFEWRAKRHRGQRGWVTEKVEETDAGHLLQVLLQQVYGETESAAVEQREVQRAREAAEGSHHRPRSAEMDYREDAVPRTVLVSQEPEDREQMEQWLTELRGSRVSVSTPQRGEKAQLMQTVQENARQALALHKSRRAGDITTRSASLLSRLYCELGTPVIGQSSVTFRPTAPAA